MCYKKYGKLSITDETVIMHQARLNQWRLEPQGVPPLALGTRL